MDDSSYGKWDKLLIRAAAQDGLVDFNAERAEYDQDPSKSEPILDAALFTILYTGRQPPGSDSAQISPLCKQWRIKGARFSGLVDLSDLCNAGGGALSALEFDHCVFPGGFRADHVSLRRLSISDCSFGRSPGLFGHLSSLSLHNSHIGSDLTLTHLRSLVPEDSLNIFATGLHVEGSLRLRDTELSLPPDDRTSAEDPTQYALDLHGADIRNLLSLSPRTTAQGGVRLRSIKVGGDLVCGDLQVTGSFGFNPESDGPLRLQHYEKFTAASMLARFAVDGIKSSIGGNLLLNALPGGKGLTAFGRVSFYGAQIEGSVALEGASFIEQENDYSLLLNAAVVRGNLFSSDGAPKEGVELKLSGIGGFTGLSVGGDVTLTGKFVDFNGAGLKVEGDTTLAIQVSSSVNLGGARLKGLLDLSQFSFVSLNPLQPSNFRFTIKDADVGHTIFLADSSTSVPLWFKSCHRTRMLCYPGYELFEIELDRGLAYILWKRGDSPQVLYGVSPSLHKINSEGSLNLATPEAIADYIRLFCAFVWGEEGPFVILEDKGQIPDGAIVESKPGILDSIGPLVVKDQFTADEFAMLRRHVEANVGRVLDPEEWARYESFFRNSARVAYAHIRYSNFVFLAPLVVLDAGFDNSGQGSYRRGMLLMLEDHTQAKLDPKLLPRYHRPFTLRPLGRDYKPDVVSAEIGPRWESFDDVELTLRLPDWRSMLERQVARFQNASIDLTNASCRTLEDADGSAWGTDITELKLENFTYSTIGTPETRGVELSRYARLLMLVLGNRDRIPPVFLQRSFFVKAWFVQRLRAPSTYREQWLGRMDRNIFRPQPYAQLAKVLYAGGDTDTAKRIEAKKVDLEVQDRSIYLKRKLLTLPVFVAHKVLWRIFRLCFLYGLSPARATATCVFFLLLGWGTTAVLNADGYLTQNTSTAATMLTRDNGNAPVPVFLHANGPADPEDLPCRNVINNFVYAADVFVPLLDLREEGRCDIRSAGPKDSSIRAAWSAHETAGKRLAHTVTAAFRAPALWQFAKSLYATVGWLVISMAILTYSGVLRRWGEK